jgi:hypothetical protein
VIVLCGRADGTFVPKDGVIRLENKWERPAASPALVKEGRVAECAYMRQRLSGTRGGYRETERLTAENFIHSGQGKTNTIYFRKEIDTAQVKNLAHLLSRFCQI